ncbi:MAG: hypothetical protein ABTQ27_07935 [Amaricoccus sp.]|uniref:hypothetical protein n=1 Tax=Amaricoccus sp. TaxID=1872485 RepID=UPI003315BCDF
MGIEAQPNGHLPLQCHYSRGWPLDDHIAVPVRSALRLSAVPAAADWAAIALAAAILAIATLGTVTLTSRAIAGGDTPLSNVELVRARVMESVGRPVEINVTTLNSAHNWILACGVPVEPSWHPFEIERSNLAGSEFGAQFCGLLRATPDGPELVAFEIGSNDIPAIGWIEEYGLPGAILED